MKDKLTASEKKVLTYWSVAALILFAIVLVLGLITITKKIKEDSNFVKNYTHVTDLNRYATVNNALNKYYIFLNDNDKDAVLKILSNNYKKKNNITNANVNNHVTFEQNLYFNSRSMCYKNLSKNQITYLVSGFESNKFTGERHENKYYQVILDSDDFHFIINPIEESVFLGDCNE